jgi:hypothetical protein
MPAFGSSLKPQELDALVAFLQSRKRPLRPQDVDGGVNYIVGTANKPKVP